MSYTCIRIEGGLLSADFLERITEMEGQKPKDFGLSSKDSLIDEISAIFSKIKKYWESFLHRLSRKDLKESKTTITREQWVIPLLEALGYKLTYQRRAEQIDGRTYPISHRAGEDNSAPPVHIVSCEQELGEKPTIGRQISPHALVQDYLNRTEHLWGIVTNGYTLRILRDAFYFTRPTYIEFDLKQMLEGEHLDEFILFYRLVHRTRFPKNISDTKDCLLERYHQESLAQGGRIREGLRNAVEKAIKTLANGFLSHPKNNNLRQKIRQKQLSSTSFYQQLLCLIYRLLFLMVVEERHILTDNEIYHRYYSISRLRNLSASITDTSLRYDDLYLGLRTLFQILRDQKLSFFLNIKPLNGELFNPLADLEDAYLKNKDLLNAIHSLSYFKPPDEKILRRVNYSALDVEELGSVYESLLDYQPVIFEKEGGLFFDLNPGIERKSTGSYYTPSCLVHELIKSALEPVIEEKLKNCSTKEEKESALLSLKICDPACGSGHFLLAAARRLGEELAKIRTQEEAPSPEKFKEAVRDVITHCIYGVDKNPLAVDLCKVALWIEGHCKGKPLTFLDHRIKCGDSLVGVFDLNVLKEGIPDEAYKPLEGDDKNIAKRLKTRNRLKEQRFFLPFKYELLAEEIQKITSIPDDDPDKIHKKQLTYEALRQKSEVKCQFQAADLWTSAFFIEKTSDKEPLVPLSLDVKKALNGKCLKEKVNYAQDLSKKLRFFHWPLEFPEVFAKGGFDVVLGNPPWEKIKLQEKEFFAIRAPEIANAANRATRQRLIKKLKEENPKLYREFLQAKHDADATSLFLRASGRFPLTARGDINTYSVFAELALRLTGPEGRTGIIVPTGIATDDTNKHFFSHLIENSFLVSLYDFENREGIFPAVHRSYKFSLLTLHYSPLATHHSPNFVFFATRVEHLKDKHRLFTLTAEDIARINPNTRTTPIFRTSYDAELTKKIYRHVPVLINEKTGKNPWSVRFLRMFDMSSDSHLFRTRKELEAEGYELKGNIFVKTNDDIYLPLYEAKMIWQFDHRFGSYEGVSSRSSTHLPMSTPDQYTDPSFVIKPWYWILAEKVLQRLENWKKSWLIGFRNVTNATNERTAIFSLIPLAGVGNSTPILLVGKFKLVSCFLANLSSLIFDYVTRRKLGGTNLNFHYVKQLPIIPPETYTVHHLLFATPRVMELVYTAWDLKPFADDIWAEADETLCIAIKKQWEENQKETGGHKNTNPPDWLEILYSLNPDNPNKDTCPLPPFRWNEERRARLRAELDAFFAKLYGLTEDELRYILDPQDVFGENYPGETFRVLKEKEIRQFGEYRTKRLVLEAWEKIDNFLEKIPCAVTRE